jgi:hypothetical protein
MSVHRQITSRRPPSLQGFKSKEYHRSAATAEGFQGDGGRACGLVFTSGETSGCHRCEAITCRRSRWRNLHARRPLGVRVLSWVIGDVDRVSTGKVHDVHLLVSVAVADETDLLAVRRPSWRSVAATRPRHVLWVAAAGVCNVDLLAARNFTGTGAYSHGGKNDRGIST